MHCSGSPTDNLAVSFFRTLARICDAAVLLQVGKLSSMCSLCKDSRIKSGLIRCSGKTTYLLFSEV